MRVISVSLAALVLASSAVGSPALAANQTILGNVLQLKNPSTDQKRKVVCNANEKASSNTLVGNPTVSGATVTISANGGTPSSQTFNLAQGTDSKGKPLWSGDGVKGFKYKDKAGVNGPIKTASIKKNGKGVFQIKVSGDGKLGPISVLPPNPGQSGCMLFEIGGGDSYSVAFLPLDGVITNKGALEYKHKKVSAEASCTTSTTTTTTSTTTSTTLCAPATFDDGITAVVDATLRNWPGGSASFGTASCGVTVAAPSGNISNLSGDTWTVTSKTSFGTCNLTSQLPSCNTVGAVASLLANGRPVCSNSSDVLASGPSTAHVSISCF